MNQTSLSGPNVTRTGAAGTIRSNILRQIAMISSTAGSACARGIVLDEGWIRVFGDGVELPSLSTWNAGSRLQLSETGPSFYVGNDVLGGLFLLNPQGDVAYVGPDSLEVEEIAPSFDDFLEFLLSGDLDQFYQDYRFPKWRDEVSRLSLDESFFSYPPLWADGGEEAFLARREIVPALELRTFVLKAMEALT